MYQLKTGHQLVHQQEFHRRLLSEYNPHFTLDKYVAYLELKKIISDIVVEQHRYDSMREKTNNAMDTLSTNNGMSGVFGPPSQNVSVCASPDVDNTGGLEFARKKSDSSTTYAPGPRSCSNIALRSGAGTVPQTYTYLYTSKTPGLGPQRTPLDDDMPPSLSSEMTTVHNTYAAPSGNIPNNLPSRLLIPKSEEIERSRQKLADLHAKFFSELKQSHRRVKAFLIEKENAATEHIAELRKHSEAVLAKLPQSIIPSIFRRVRNIALFRDLNTVGFQKVMQKYFQNCCTNSLEQQAKLRAADTIIAGSHLCKPTFDADQQLDLITSIYATIEKVSYEEARHRLDLAIERDSSTHNRIMAVTDSFFYTSSFVHHQNQGSFALKLLTGLGAKALTKKVSSLSHSSILNCDNRILSAGELSIKISEAVRGDDVYVLQSMAACEGRSMSTAVMQLALSMQTLALASAARVTAVIPYMAYNSNPNASAAIAEMLMVNGCKQVLTLDLRSDQVEGMFGNLPIYSVTALMEFIAYITNRIVKEEKSVRNLVVVSPDGDGVARARRFADALSKNLNKVIFGAESSAMRRPDHHITLPAGEDDLNVPMMLVSASADEVGSNPMSRTLSRLQSTLLNVNNDPGSTSAIHQSATAAASPATATNDTERVFIPIATALKRPSHQCEDIDVIGEVKGQHCFIVDTIIDECVNAATVARKLKDAGAAHVTVVATHALFSSEASFDLLAEPFIDEVLITDSVPQDDALKRPEIAKKLRIVSVAPLLAEAIQRLHSDNCLSTLFDR